MTLKRFPAPFLLAAGAAALLAALGFLFVKTQSAGYKDQVAALALVRELRDGDLRWDADALRLANDLGPTQAAVPDRRPIFARIFHELERGHAAIGKALAPLRADMEAKQAAFGALRAAHARTLAALEATRAAIMMLTTEAAAVRARDPRTAERATALIGRVEQVRAVARTSDIESHAELAAAFEPLIATLVPAAQETDARLLPAAEALRAAATEVLAARTAEAASWERFSFLTLGARSERLAQDLARSIEGELDDKDRWRAYLFAYAAALLIGVGYLGWRVHAAQAELRRANDDLETRVSDRTRELEKTVGRLRESEAQLVQTEKMSSLGQLVAGIAHEINTPLAYVKNSVATVRDRMPELHATLEDARSLLALLHAESPDAAELQTAYDRLAARLAQLDAHQVLQDLEALTRDGMHGIEQISELVTGLRNFSRLDRSRIASFNVNEGVNAALLIAKPALRKIDVEKRLGEVPSITCSPSQVNQVLLNIVTNAAQANDKPRGHISVATRREGADHVAIEISDKGRGIAPESLGRIFDPFYTTKEPGQGTGLGLSIAYKIVAQHGGRIDVRSQPGAGSTFVVVLPLEAAAEAGSEVERPPAERAA